LDLLDEILLRDVCHQTSFVSCRLEGFYGSDLGGQPLLESGVREEGWT
jgi:hypothetical protein